MKPAALWAHLLAAALLAAGTTRAAAQLPDVQSAAGIEYLSGGIGLDESQAILGASRNWPLTLEFSQTASPRAHYVADVDVSIHEPSGRSLLGTTADGPYLLVRLAPGRYTINATLGGKTLTRTVTLRAGAPARLSFQWPADVATQRY